MLWTTAGTNRVCSRCLALKGTVVGYTDESGVTLPPLHPRCRCAIEYREVGTPREQNIKEQHHTLTLQSEQLETRWRALQSEIERLAPQGTSPRLEALYAEQQPIGDKLWETERNLRRIRLWAAENNIILTTGLSRSLYVEDVAVIVEQVRKAPKNLQILWNMAEADMKIIDKNFRETAHYDLKRRGILFDAPEDFYNPTRKYKTILHETGHLLDHFMGGQLYLHSYVYEGELFSKTLIEEANSAVKEELKRLKAEAVSLGRSSKNIKLADAQHSLSKTLQELDHAARSEVSDIFSGVTKNKVKGGYYHENKYWREAETLPTEAFAHMFCATIQSPESLALIKKYFPKSYEMFEEMIDSWVQEKKLQWLGKNLIGKSSTAYKENMNDVLKKDFLLSKCHQMTSETR